MFNGMKSWLSRWTWKKVYRMIIPILIELLKDQLDELLTIAKKEGNEAVEKIKEMIDKKL